MLEFPERFFPPIFIAELRGQTLEEAFDGGVREYLYTI